MKKNSNLVLIGFIFVIMTSLALAENFRGIFIPEFKSQFQIIDTDIGIMDSIGTLAYVIFTFIGSLLCQKFGQKKVFIIGIGTMIVSMVMYFSTSNGNMLYANMFVLNMGLALTSIAINTIIPILSVGLQAVLMNATHFCYGLGASVAPYIGANLLSRGYNWNNIYLGLGVFFIIILMSFLFVKVPKANKSEAYKERNKLTSKKEVYILMLFILGLGFYVFAELGTGTWFINYLNENLGLDAKLSSYYMSLFFIMITIGRLTGGFIVEKVGYLKCILVYVLIAFFMYLTGVVLGNNMVILISLSGFFFSIVYPTTLLCIGKIFKENSSSAIGIVVTLSSVVRMLLSLGFGKINDVIGTEKAFYIIPACLIASFIFMLIAYMNTKEIFKSVKEN